MLCYHLCIFFLMIRYFFVIVLQRPFAFQKNFKNVTEWIIFFLQLCTNLTVMEVRRLKFLTIFLKENEIELFLFWIVKILHMVYCWFSPAFNQSSAVTFWLIFSHNFLLKKTSEPHLTLIDPFFLFGFTSVVCFLKTL